MKLVTYAQDIQQSEAREVKNYQASIHADWGEKFPIYPRVGGSCITVSTS